MTTPLSTAAAFADFEEPIRSELFSVERLEQHAESLAAAQTVSKKWLTARLLTPRVQENGRVLLDSYRILVEAIKQEHTITPAAEWLVDNFYILEDQLREIRESLPPGFYRELPKLSSGPLEGFPRVYGVAWAFVAHTDSRIDPEVLRRFVVAYQRVQPLTIGELWALAITLRIVLVENLRRITERIVRSRTSRQEADALADRILGVGGQPAVPAIETLRSYETAPLDQAFTVELVQRLRDVNPNVTPILEWLDKRLAVQGTRTDEIVRNELQQQAALNVTVRNIITSMRMMSSFDWQEFFEDVSLVDQILSEETGFAKMDFGTRDSSRHAIEDLAKHSDHSEVEIARRVANRVQQAFAEHGNGLDPSHNPRTTPGYYLYAAGRREFESELGYRVPWNRRLLRWYVRSAAFGYLSTIAVVTALILALPLLHDAEAGLKTWWLVLLGVLAVIPASDLAIALVNLLVTGVLEPRHLPRLDLEDGVSADLRTIVVMPTLLTSKRAIQENVERLEIHYLANPDGYLHFALLSDWTDAVAETVAGDDELLSQAAEGIARLNERYGPVPGGGSRFHLFHRKRVWNDRDRIWMGWERKRGKLHELNQFLRGSVTTTFLPAGGRAPEFIPDVRYVITLDADTHLPRGAAYKLVATIAHPLNHPRFDEGAGRVVEGYGVIQPRLTPLLPSVARGSLFYRIFSGPSGIDPYSAAASDVYQDLFREGSYTGKGVYDLDTFEAALANKVPENALLSHDLFEGTFARTALATDIELFEEFPSNYEAAASRQHRWVRGDWQLLPWMIGRVHVPLIGLWKMIDNLRRSLSAPAAFFTLIVAWLISPTSPWVWTRFILATIAIPYLLPFLLGLNPPRRGGISKRSYFRNVLSDLALGASQTAASITFLAYQAWLMLDAILRTVGRLFFTHRNLLEWVTAAQAKYAVDLKLFNIYRRMIGGVLFAIAAAVLVFHGRHQAWIAATPFLLLWLAAPALARWISLPPKPAEPEPLSESDVATLRTISRRTWRFFETFVTAEDNFLPPDNFQETPDPVVAHRTSATNIGLYLLSTLAARDFGWIGADEATDRLGATFAAMGGLETFRGHFLNWYDTRTRMPLEPRYISSVDSGNLAGHLLTVAGGCHDLLHKTFLGPQLLDGLRDSLQLLRKALDDIPEVRRTQTVTRKQLNGAVNALAASLRSIPLNPAGWTNLLRDLETQTHILADIAKAFVQERGEAPDCELCVWADAARASVASSMRDAKILIPWLHLSPEETAGISERRALNATEWMAIEPFFQAVPSLANALERFEGALAALDELRTRLRSEVPAPSSASETIARIDALTRAITRSASDASGLADRISTIAAKSEKIFQAMDFSFLLDHTRKLFSIGYRVADGVLDETCYDLLASEARLASFVAIAKGDAPSAHWFRLGRSLTPVGRDSALVSWSGSMFEYLMPELVMRSPEGSLLSQTAELVVRRQISYGTERGVPWGVSESAFNARDAHLTYNYSAFGVPGLGLKRGLSDDIVIAPYATALAAMVNPSAATENFIRIARLGGEGKYGFYDALDYTTERVPEGEDVAIVRTYMAHHEAMSLVALDNVLNRGAMHSRFHCEPIVQSAELLLQERTPRDVLVARPRAEEVSAVARVRDLVSPVERRFTTPHDAAPRTQLLSNGRYSVMLTAAGSGYSRWGDIAITRWREDPTSDCWGSYFYLRDANTGQVWSAGYQPIGIEPEEYEARFYEDRAEISRRDRSFTTSVEVIVSTEDDAEMRRVSVTNRGLRARDIQITSYAELSLTSQGADVAHPAFAKLFVETEFLPDVGALLATRRLQSDKDTPVWVAHVVAGEQETSGDLQCESDRSRFVGRTHDARNPVSIMDGPPLSNTVGPVLDSILSLRRTVHIPAGATTHLVFSTIVASTRERVLDLADKYRDASTFERIETLAWTQAQVQLRHMGIGPDEAGVFQRLANSVLYSDSSLRPAPNVLNDSSIEVASLWACGISGDLPIVLAFIDEAGDIEFIRQLLRAHEYWRLKNLSSDLVIVNEKPPSYEQDLQDSLAALVRGTQARISQSVGGPRGNVFLLRGDLISPQLRNMLQAIARVVLFSRRGTLPEQVTRSQRSAAILPPAVRAPIQDRSPAAPLKPGDLDFFNGLGGFADHGREYVTVLTEGLRTPQPWINVVANPAFGFLASESGGGYTWSLNSHENQLTPWSNDPVCDPPGEAIYIRDDATGDVWTPTASPVREEGAVYIARHGQGYTRYQHASHGLFHELLQFVPLNDPIKISRLTLQNNSSRTRRLSITSYTEWVLGSSRTAAAPYIVTEYDARTGAILARNGWGGEFAGRIAFADMAGRQTSWTGDRREFLGRNGAPRNPAALHRAGRLSGKVGAALDPCTALQTSIEMRPGARTEIVFFLGQAENRESAREMISRYRRAELELVLAEVAKHWNGLLGTLEVSTPEPSMNVLLNRWLLYQTLACRIWARTAFYQASGAFGFRDQLQDVMALCTAKRDVAREHILVAASRQFVEGDVQHWWHPPGGRGIRTRMSDDLLWLPYTVNHFIRTTGDMSILDENVPFLEGDALAESQSESYFQPRVSEIRESIFEHCARAIDRSLAVGVHGLPLMGSGDWNDGMNRVGIQGKGESVWLAWFLYKVLVDFANVAGSRGEYQRAETWRLHTTALKAAIEREAWDGEWYRRAYFDDGTPLGSAQNQECRIDSIAQSWGVISGAAEPGRAVRAMNSVEENLIRRRDGLILLLTPPFDHAPVDPGYIKGYVPGIRENGGQYTHAAVWSVLAFAELGLGDKAGEFFRMLNPINRTSSRAAVQRYKIEPYVIAGDVYAQSPHVGRGGWSWYTGAAGWLYRVGTESILGFHLHGMSFRIDPCIPRDWPGFSLVFRYHSAVYNIKVENPSSVARGVALTKLDGKVLAGLTDIPLVDDGAVHELLVVMG